MFQIVAQRNGDDGKRSAERKDREQSEEIVEDLLAHIRRFCTSRTFVFNRILNQINLSYYHWVSNQLWNLIHGIDRE